MRERFFEPLGMLRTAYDIRDFEPDTLAVPYDREGESFEARERYGLPTYADGQLRSSANDLARYLAMMLDDGRFEGTQLLSAASIATIETELHAGPESDEVTQALYWSKRFGGKLLAHSGGDYGVSTFLFYHPTWQSGGVILMNTRWDGVDELMITCLQSLTDAMRAFKREEPQQE